MTVDDPRYEASVITTIARLPKANVEEIISYWSFDGKAAETFASHDRHKTFVAVKLRGKDGATKTENYHLVKERLAAPGLTVQYGGSVPLGEEFGQQVVTDIVRAEMITALPLFILLMILSARSRRPAADGHRDLLDHRRPGRPPCGDVCGGRDVVRPGSRHDDGRRPVDRLLAVHHQPIP